MSEPADSQMQITANMTGLINFGVFKLKILLINRALEATAETIQQISGQEINHHTFSLTRWCACDQLWAMEFSGSLRQDECESSDG